jgi:hypothetical protein
VGAGTTIAPDGKIKVPTGTNAININVYKLNTSPRCGYLLVRTYAPDGSIIRTINTLPDDWNFPGSGFTCPDTSPSTNTFANMNIGDNVDSIGINVIGQEGGDITPITIERLAVEFILVSTPHPAP